MLQLEQEIGARVIGQDVAVSAVANSVRQARAGLLPPNRPLGVFLFLGPTGVGKTELAKGLSQFLFDDEKAMLRVDMSEMSERFSVTRLVGAPPGYVGYEEGCKLTEAVRRRPFQVILLDEIEKAHPEVSNLLLQVFDEGRLTDSHGRTVDFRNTIIVMTSNLGSGEILEHEVGDAAERAVMERVESFFAPELLNRIDEVLHFNTLGREDMGRIVLGQLNLLKQRLDSERSIELELDDSVAEKLANWGFEPRYGARPLKRAIQRHLLNPLAKSILSGTVRNGETARVELDGEGESLVVVPNHQPEEQAVVEPLTDSSNDQVVEPVADGSNDQVVEPLADGSNDQQQRV